MLHKLVRKDEKWNWGEEQETVFKKLKMIFTMRLVLVASDLDKEIRVKVDASKYAIGEVLLIKYEDEK